MKRVLVFALVVAGVAAASASAVQRSSSPTAAGAAGATSCTSGAIGFMGPITGPVAFLGKAPSEARAAPCRSHVEALHLACLLVDPA